MKILKLPLFVLLAIFTLSSCTTESIYDNSETIELTLVKKEVKTIELEILELLNDHRLSLGLNPLEEMAVIKSVAHSHTDYMVDNEEVSHHNFFTRSDYLKSNTGAIKVSENVAFGYSSAESVVRAWIKSESHKKNLEGDYTNFDISAEKNEEGRWYYTNIFIKK